MLAEWRLQTNVKHTEKTVVHTLRVTIKMMFVTISGFPSTAFGNTTITLMILLVSIYTLSFSKTLLALRRYCNIFPK
jgi:hypothetical protein